MQTQSPGTLTASRVAVLPDGTMAEAVLTERTAAYGERLREAHVRLHRGGGWTPWRLLTGNAFDISVAPDLGQEEPTALVGVLVWIPSPAARVTADHAAHRTVYFRVTASGVSSLDL